HFRGANKRVNHQPSLLTSTRNPRRVTGAWPATRVEVVCLRNGRRGDGGRVPMNLRKAVTSRPVYARHRRDRSNSRIGGRRACALVYRKHRFV
ncbi:hypothetical protein EVAR_41815_1, partial [Eumeta japonica]